VGEGNFMDGDQLRTRRPVSVPEAAELLGITVDAVRGRIKRGTIDAERGSDGSVYVYVPTDQLRLAKARSSDQSALTEYLESEVAFLRDELERKDALLMNMIHALRSLPSSSLKDHAPKAPQQPETADAGTAVGKGPSQPDGEDDQRILRPYGNTSVRSMHRPISLITQDGLAVLLAATLPITLTLVTVAVSNARPDSVFSPLLIYLLFHFFPLFCGLWVGLAWQGMYLRRYILLGLFAGASEVAVFVLFRAFPAIPAAISGGDAVYKVTPSDVIAVLATVTLFISGGLFGDLLQWMRSPRGLRPPGAWATLLIQATGAAFIGLIANVASAAVQVI
jgi:hypothetical protein